MLSSVIAALLLLQPVEADQSTYPAEQTQVEEVTTEQYTQPVEEYQPVEGTQPVEEPAPANEYQTTQAPAEPAPESAPAPVEEVAQADPRDEEICRNRMVPGSGIGARLVRQRICKTRAEWATPERRRR